MKKRIQGILNVASILCIVVIIGGFFDRVYFDDFTNNTVIKFFLSLIILVIPVYNHIRKLKADSSEYAEMETRLQTALWELRRRDDDKEEINNE